MITNAITSAFRIRIKCNLHPEERTPTRGDNRWKSQRMEGYSLCSPFEAEMCWSGVASASRIFKVLICTHDYFCFHFFCLPDVKPLYFVFVFLRSSNRMNSTTVIFPFKGLHVPPSSPLSFQTCWMKLFCSCYFSLFQTSLNTIMLWASCQEVWLVWWDSIEFEMLNPNPHES